MTGTTIRTAAALMWTLTAAPLVPAVSRAQVVAPPAADLLARRYREGETFRYRMTASNRGPSDTLPYSLTADVTVQKDTDGRFFEEVAWHDVVVNGAPFALPAASQAFRQRLTLEANPKYTQIPDLSKVHPMLIGPITDLLTFYADMLVVRQGALEKPGDHFYFKHGTPASWADGQRVIIGESSIDFDLTLKGVDRTAEAATLLIRHVPSTPPQIKIPAEWMLPPVADTPNNWVLVERTGASNFTASIGQETFDVAIMLSLTDGHVISAILDNPVQVRERECENEALTVCGGPIRYEIRRHVEITSAR